MSAEDRRDETDDGRADGAPVALVVEEERDLDLRHQAGSTAPAIVVFWVLAVDRLPAVLHPLRAEQFARLDRGGGALPPDPGLLPGVGQRGPARQPYHAGVPAARGAGGLGKALAVLAELITFGLYGTLTWIGIALTQKTRQKMVTVPVPKAWIYTICVAALARHDGLLSASGCGGSCARAAESSSPSSTRTSPPTEADARCRSSS